LHAGDRLTRAEFERRYQALPQVNKAELVEGVVYMPSPVSAEEHGEPHFDLVTWLGIYRAQTPGVYGGDNTTLRLDVDNEPQPDAHLRIRPEAGGSARLVDGFIEGAPELVAEVSATSASYDLHDKFNAYRRNGVQEYLVWRVEDGAIDWFVLRDGRFDRLPLDPDGIYRSRIFPGLWLDAAALIARNVSRVFDVLQSGLATPEHADFLRKLQTTP
jgi:Uma2 family endonuclease